MPDTRHDIIIIIFGCACNASDIDHKFVGAGCRGC